MGAPIRTAGILAIALLAPAHTAAAHSQTITHWTAVVCTSEASSVTLQAGPAHDQNDVFATWHKADGNKIFAFPEKLQTLNKIYFQATLPPEQHRETKVCVKYDGRAKKSMEFDGDNEHDDIDASDSENDCRC